MGTNFFNPNALTHADERGFFGKMSSQLEPISKYGRYVSPGMNVGYKQGQAWDKRWAAPVSTGPYAGLHATLAGANAGYAPQAPRVAPAPAAPAPRMVSQFGT